MAKIFDVIYRRTEEEPEVISLGDITPKNYRNKYRGNLFCSTPNCTAMISFVARSGKKSYLRAWRGHQHEEHCTYYKDKVTGSTSVPTSGDFFAPLSEKHMLKSLKDAFTQETMTDEQREEERQKNESRNRKRQTQATKKSEQESFDFIIDPADAEKVKAGVQSRLWKRTVDALTSRDIGKTRTIIGEFVEADLTSSRPKIRIHRNEVYGNLLFEEAFFSESEELRNQLALVAQYAKDFEPPLLVVVGQVRAPNKNEEFEIALFNPTAFLVQGRSLNALAIAYSTKQLSF
ncbi:hypothetical protein [Planococcus sp. ISL-109]|uniref:hypothetical protein n=1 Tax=Planococcus sp. ISL-109 TaxID=2819166 RepID=UPI001BEB5CCB|nr:hypothetical protein [Planococcus sp. ISL-109]MBT2584222.1 hypothetical protein [Planococcus sp. ISL-109]